MARTVQELSDEVAALMVQRFGGARRGTSPDLPTMLRRRGGALPRRQRKAARVLAAAAARAGQPRVAQQIDDGPAIRAHDELVAYLRPLGAAARWQDRALGVAAALALGLVILGGLAVWIMVRRGML